MIMLTKVWIYVTKTKNLVFQRR